MDDLVDSGSSWVVSWEEDAEAHDDKDGSDERGGVDDGSVVVLVAVVLSNPSSKDVGNDGEHVVVEVKSTKDLGHDESTSNSADGSDSVVADEVVGGTGDPPSSKAAEGETKELNDITFSTEDLSLEEGVEDNSADDTDNASQDSGQVSNTEASNEDTEGEVHWSSVFVDEVLGSSIGGTKVACDAELSWCGDLWGLDLHCSSN